MAATIASSCVRGTSSRRPRRSPISTCGTGSIARRWSICSRWSADEFDTRMQGSAIRRIGYERWLRNHRGGDGQCVARRTGSARRGPRSSTRCVRAPTTRPPLVREHVEWALKRKSARAGLGGAREGRIGQSMFNAVIDAPFGKVGIRTRRCCRARDRLFAGFDAHIIAPDSPLGASRPRSRFERYFDRGVGAFRLAARVASARRSSSAYGRRSASIPPGVVLTYGQLAKRSAVCRGRSGRRAARTIAHRDSVSSGGGVERHRRLCASRRRRFFHRRQALAAGA